MQAPPPEARSSSRLGRWFLALLAIALVAHVALLTTFVRRVLKIRYPVDLNPAEFAYVALPALALAGVLLWRFPRHALATTAAMIVVVAGALFSPGIVLTVCAMILCAYVVGERAMSSVRGPPSSGASLPAAAFVLVGIALWIGLAAAFLSARIHIAPVYAAFLLLPLIAFWRTTVSALVACARRLASPGALSWSERGWVAVLIALATIHLFVAARPEVGFDAQTMHLQFAQLLRAHGRWSFDVERYIWAVMPLGADLGFAAAYLLNGEAAAHLLNFAFGALMSWIVYLLVRLYARRELALAAVALLVSTPLVFMETATLYVENLWTAFLLAALLLALLFRREPRLETLCALAFLAAGAMQCKIIGAIWLVPVGCAVAYLAWKAGPRLHLGARALALLALATAIGAWPYANAWIRTGNPAFPFVNALFNSPYFDTSASFNNENYNAPLSASTPYDLVLSSGRFIEGTDGALGTQWLFLIPIALAGLAFKRPRAQWLSLFLGVSFFVVVYLQQSYLRYLMPALVLFAVFAAWVTDDLVDSPALRVGLLCGGIALCALNVRMMPAAYHANARLCVACSYDDAARRDFVETFSQHRVVSEYLNRTAPQARVGFLLLNAESPSGYVGYSRSANWHDWPMFNAVTRARDGEDIRAAARRYRLTHVVYSASGTGATNDAIRAFASQHATPVWRFGDYVVAAVKPD